MSSQPLDVGHSAYTTVCNSSVVEIVERLAHRFDNELTSEERLLVNKNNNKEVILKDFTQDED
ncbi:hypothetical protein [Vibrio owensii]|uniref:hypothetical protein n=1 Tax=Vibrio harveyi group TaxID=717610 RepID=UPI003CC63D8E